MDRMPGAERQARRWHLPPRGVQLRIAHPEPAVAPGHRWTGRVSLPLLLGLALLGMTACAPAGSQPNAGDPGNHRLDQLSSDPVFAALPPGAVAKGPLTKAPARYRTPAFQPPGWDGPAVTLTFTSPNPPASVFSFFQARADSAGWRPGNQNALGYPQTWTKTYPDGVHAVLSLIRT